MKTLSFCVLPSAFSSLKTSAARLFGLAVPALALSISFAATGATLISRAPNAAVHIGVPWSELEFENPLAGTEAVLGHAVLDWRDADYSPGPPPWFDDWSVSGSASGSLGGHEIYLSAGDSGSTATTTPSTIVSIHLNGDNNDGIAQALVDGNEVARLDMFYPGGPGGCCQTALVLVRGLANTTHTITVNDLGPGQGGMDVHIMGAAALKESPIKWNQPPVESHPTNIFYGWNQPSEITVPGMLIAADDWVCSSTNPVTKIRWWGSYLNWTSSVPPAQIPAGFQILFYTDVPAGTNPPFSHPGGVVWQIYCTNFTSQFVGWDYDPRNGNLEACFLYEQTLTPNEYFEQTTPSGTIYWISIAANYLLGPQAPAPWGWKTRPRDPTSPAPDDAVMSPNNVPGWTPIWWPDPTNSWDMAFELISERQVETFKWLQLPDLSTNGMDVNATWNPGAPPAFLLADDFLCMSTGPITHIAVWGSWTNDVDWYNTIFTLSIHDDIPANISPTGYSMPGQLRWLHTFLPGQYSISLYAGGINEWWFTPTNRWRFPGDHMCFQYDFIIPELEAFQQEGTPAFPKVYWLDVQAQPQQQSPPFALFGWKTCPDNWNDDAVWVNANEPHNGTWNKLTYPPPHARHGQTVDLAFRLSSTESIREVKWSQPPVTPYIPVSFYNGWNEISWYGGEWGFPIIADDWVCTTTNPVTDLHWWGSFVGWNDQTPPPLPDAFFISFWTDVPAGGQWQFSHPGICLQTFACSNFSCSFVGWDVDPRNTNAPFEACFRFDQDLATNAWFHQDPGNGTNIYWISISAFYSNPGTVLYPWGWKTRPRDINSPAPDDAVRIFDPTAPLTGMPFLSGYPIWWPDPTNSWDMAFVLTTRATEEQDFGDAPDLPYPTMLSSAGARHFILPGFNLGNLIDAETNGLPNATATGDDLNNLDDEDGVTFVPPLLVSTQAWVKVVLNPLSSSGQLDAWVDFDHNGVWQSGEKVFNNLTLLSGTNNLSFIVPSNAWVGPTFARFRLSSAGGLLPTGTAADGEIEDHMITLMQRGPVVTNIVITNIVVSSTNATLWWNAQTDIHYWVLATTNLQVWLTNWSWIGSEVIGPVNTETENYRFLSPTNRFYRVTAPYVWP